MHHVPLQPHRLLSTVNRVGELPSVFDLELVQALMTSRSVPRMHWQPTVGQEMVRRGV